MEFSDKLYLFGHNDDTDKWKLSVLEVEYKDETQSGDY